MKQSTKGYRAYRGSNRGKHIALYIILGLVLVALVVVLIGQNYVAYDADGNLSFQFPWQSEEKQEEQKGKDLDVVVDKDIIVPNVEESDKVMVHVGRADAPNGITEEDQLNYPIEQTQDTVDQFIGPAEPTPEETATDQIRCPEPLITDPATSSVEETTDANQDAAASNDSASWNPGFFTSSNDSANQAQSLFIS